MYILNVFFMHNEIGLWILKYTVYKHVSRRHDHESIIGLSSDGYHDKRNRRQQRQQPNIVSEPAVEMY